MLNEFHLFTPSECSRWCDALLSASSHWDRRARGVDYYTLGAAYYLDIDQEDFISYVVRLSKVNPVLNELFGGLYALILDMF